MKINYMEPDAGREPTVWLPAGESLKRFVSESGSLLQNVSLGDVVIVRTSACTRHT